MCHRSAARVADPGATTWPLLVGPARPPGADPAARRMSGAREGEARRAGLDNLNGVVGPA